MELTIEQALQQGIAAHKEGKLEEAERLYRAILQSQPTHPDANHNLGVIAVSVNKANAALSFFKTALETNPKIEQFWLSYIGTLLTENKTKAAKAAILDARKQGFDSEKINALENQLKQLSVSSKAPDSNISPSESQLNNLLELYQNGRYEEAEKLAVSITQQFPEHPFGWKALGVVLAQTDRSSESLVAKQKVLHLTPQDAEAHSNLGNTLNDLGRFEEAEASLKQAIALKPDFTQAHYNLGITLKELGRLEEAEASYTKAIALKSDYAEAHCSLAVVLTELGRLAEGEVNYRQAILLDTNYLDAYNNLGGMLVEMGRLDEAKAIYKQAMAIKPDHVEAIHNLSIVQAYMNDLNAAIHSLENILRLDADNYGLRAGVLLAIYRFLESDFIGSKKYLLAASAIQEELSREFNAERVYQDFLLKILNWHEYKKNGTHSLNVEKTIYIVGESHSLVGHQLHIERSDGNFLCKAKLIMGCKQFHLGNSLRNQYKNKFESIFLSLPKSSDILLTIGEIDCRLDSGIISYKSKFPKKEINEIIITTVEDYLAYILKINSNCQHNIIIQGVPCPNIDTESHYKKSEVTLLIEVIKYFNSELKNKSKEKGFNFLDVHKLTDRGDGISNTIWHIDDTHLSPEGFLEAWNRYVPEQKPV